MDAGGSKATCLTTAGKAVADELRRAETAGVKDALLKGRADAYRSATLCSTDEITNCTASAKARAGKLGSAVGEQKGDEQLNALRSSAQVQADCSEGGSDEDECEIQAEDEFVKQKGAKEQWVAKKQLVKVLSKAYGTGDLTKIVRQKSVETCFCDTEACSSEKTTSFKGVATTRAAAQGGNGIPGPA